MIWLLYVAMAIVCAALCGLLAGPKNRDRLSWVILGAALGVIGLLWLLVLPRGNDPAHA